MKKFLFPLGLIAIAAAMIAIFAIGNKKEAAKPTGPLLGQKFPELARDHIPETSPRPQYNSNPPSSGPHYNSPATWGIKDQAENDERYVHNLEHGGIWVTYKPDLPADQIAKLKSIVGDLPPDGQFNEQKFVLTPRPANDHNISLVAWGYVYNLDAPDEVKIKQFYTEHVNKGPELIP